ncbi:MAG: hypothetical protein PHS93_08555 [Candidatus Omnitrophica bacterium]|nr:hypothetical protein [Candidatus Omnitrophota bacterium]
MMDGLFYNTSFEDTDVISRIGNLDVSLTQRFKTYFEEIRNNFNLAAGHIYSDDDLIKLNIEKRPAFEPNLFLPILLKIVGDFKATLPGIDLIGRTPSDHQFAAILQKLNDYYLYQVNDILYEMSKAYLYAAIGRGTWLKQDFCSTAKYPQGTIITQHYHPFLKFDTNMTRRDLSDCQYISDSGWYSPEELIKIYASDNKELAAEIEAKAKDLLGESDETKRKKRMLSWAERLLGVFEDYAGEKRGYDQSRTLGKDGQILYDVGMNWHDGEGRFKAVDFYHRTDRPKMILYDRANATQGDITEIVKRKENSQGDTWYDNDMLQYVRDKFTDVHIENTSEDIIQQTSIIPGLMIKAHDAPQQLQNGNFKFTYVTFYDFHPDILETKSMIDGIKDSVKSAIMRDNTNLTYLMKSVNGGLYVEEDLQKSKNFKGFSDNKIGTVKIVPTGSISQGKIKEIGVPASNIPLERYQMHKIEEIKFVSGVRDNSMGAQESSGESGRLFAQRIQAQEVMQTWASENAQSALKTITENNIYFIQNFVKGEQTFRILGDSGSIEWITVNQQDYLGRIHNDLSIGEYDVVTSLKPTGRISKEIEKQKYLELYAMAERVGPEMKPFIYKLLAEILKTTDIGSQGDLLTTLAGIVQQYQQMMQMQQGGNPQQKMLTELAIKEQTLGLQEKGLENQGKHIENKGKEIENYGKLINNQKNVLELQRAKNEADNQRFLDNIIRGI